MSGCSDRFGRTCCSFLVAVGSGQWAVGSGSGVQFNCNAAVVATTESWLIQAGATLQLRALDAVWDDGLQTARKAFL
jgi:hypothetical protein